MIIVMHSNQSITLLGLHALPIHYSPFIGEPIYDESLGHIQSRRWNNHCSDGLQCSYTTDIYVLAPVARFAFFGFTNSSPSGLSLFLRFLPLVLLSVVCSPASSVTLLAAHVAAHFSAAVVWAVVPMFLESLLLVLCAHLVPGCLCAVGPEGDMERASSTVALGSW